MSKLTRSVVMAGSPGRPQNLTFVRRVGVSYEDFVARFNAELAGREASVEIGRSRLIGQVPTGGDEDRCQIEVVLWRGPLRSPLPMKLDIVRWSATFGTVLELQPAQDVRPDDRYFREGNAVLDFISAVVTRVSRVEPARR